MVTGIRWSEWSKSDRLVRKERTVSVNSKQEADKWIEKQITRLQAKENQHEIETVGIWDN